MWPVYKTPGALLMKLPYSPTKPNDATLLMLWIIASGCR